MHFSKILRPAIGKELSPLLVIVASRFDHLVTLGGIQTGHDLEIS